MSDKDDCISRQMAIDACTDRFGICVKKEALEALPAIQTEPHWIPCSERLPEERGFYLTTTKDKAVYRDYWNEDNFDRTEMVIAWMPLPKPYLGGDE